MLGGSFAYLEWLCTMIPHRPILLVTACSDWTTRTSAARYGVTAFLNKPVRLATLQDVVQRVLKGQPLPPGLSSGAATCPGTERFP
ncbi:MAG: response regulator [Nitrospirota bacterium]